MTRKVRLCSRADVPAAGMLPLDIAGLPPVAAFDVGGEIYVTSNVCTHNVALLSDGFFEGDTIECPLHGGCFNVRTGEATQFPCEVPLQTYPVIVEGGDLYTEIKDH